MVLRTSNGSPFLVLSPLPQVRTGIRVEVFDRDNPGTLLAILSETRNREWLEELNGPGSGGFDIHALDAKLEANPGLLTYGNVVRFYLNGILRHGFRIEGVDHIQASGNDDADRWLRVTGRGPLGILEDAVVYPAGGLGGAPDPRVFTNVSSGLIIRLLIAEAQARGTALLGVTTDFTDIVDTNAAPFDTLLTLDEDIGFDLLRVAGRHTAMAADVWMDPSLVLHYANTRGIDRTLQLVNTGPVKLYLGHAITELTNAEVGRITNTILIKTPAGFLERVDLSSLALFNRREGFLSLGNVTDGGTIDKTTDKLFAELADPRASSTIELIEAEGSTPYVDFEVGDFILSPDVNGDLTKQRVRSLSVTELDDGRIRYVPELATIEEELEASLERWLAASSKGTLGGAASKVAEPNTLDTQSTTTVVDSGITDHLAGQPHPDELGDLSDVDLSGGAIVGDRIEWDGAAWVPAPAANPNVDTDVDNAPVGTTVSATFEDAPGPVEASITKLAGTDLLVELHASHFIATNPAEVELAVLVDAVDNVVLAFTHAVIDEHHATTGLVRITGLGDGTFTVRVRWRRAGGSGTVTQSALDYTHLKVTEIDA